MSTDYRLRNSRRNRSAVGAEPPFKQLFLDARLPILMEGALGERLKREHGLAFDEHVAMAGLIYDQNGAAALSRLWHEYIDVARRYRLPFMATTPTRRANRETIPKSKFTEALLHDNVAFLREIQAACGIEMYVGGLMGCKGDAYTGEGTLCETEAVAFHYWTVERFQNSKVDFLYAGIMPTLPEAAGLARAVDPTGIPYIVSFTIRQDGKLIDGTSIADAIRYIDDRTVNAPLCYMANCVHPQIVYLALSQPCNDTAIVKKRFRGVQANTSRLSYAELDGAEELKGADPKTFAEETLRLSQIGDFQIWGGCCGTDGRHMECIARRLRALTVGASALAYE